MIKQDISENLANIVFLAIGSNLGNKIKNIILTKYKLQNYPIEIIKSSSNYETISWPDNNNPKFYNIVLKVKTNFDVMKLLSICKKIEKSLGRKKSIVNSPRECDIDILDYDMISTTGSINLPHPRMHQRNFVLIPLFEIDKNWIHPISKHHIKTLIFSLPNIDISSIKQI